MCNNIHLIFFVNLSYNFLVVIQCLLFSFKFISWLVLLRLFFEVLIKFAWRLTCCVEKSGRVSTAHYTF